MKFPLPPQIPVAPFAGIVLAEEVPSIKGTVKVGENMGQWFTSDVWQRE